jgi:hypothetical protein
MTTLAEKIIGEPNKQRFVSLFMHMNSEDRKLIHHWSIDHDDSVSKVCFYMTLIGQGFIEFISDYTDRHNGDFRMYPYGAWICVELMIPDSSPDKLP